MENLKTSQSEVFFFDGAVENGIAYDQNGGKHQILAHGEKFIITKCNGEEHCFNKNGKQFAFFTKLKLVKPSKVKIELLPYVLYDVPSMKIIDMYNGVMSGGSVEDKTPNSKLININLILFGICYLPQLRDSG